MPGVLPRDPHGPTRVFDPLEPQEHARLDPNRVGVVFVHGIGTQPAAETFLDWSGPIAEVLAAWCHDHGMEIDPVRRSEYDFSGTTLPFLELTVPAYEAFPAQSWVITEAWWASVTRPPTLGTMTSYVSHALPRIMRGIREGYEQRTAAWAQRQAASQTEAADVLRASPGANTGETRAADLVLSTTRRRWDWIDLLDRFQKDATILAFGPTLVLGSLVLLAYAPFRMIPIGPLRDLAILKSADNFLTRWFGELPDILDDPVQAAEVRFRLANAIRGLRQDGCGSIVVVAHSGGAIVSWTTLLDPAYAGEQVDKLVTLGEGLQLAWRIEDAWRAPLPEWSRLRGDLTTARPDLRWADFWSSYDPAPGGPPGEPPGVHHHAEPTATINRMSILEDHGSYWSNDEGFVMPLLRHLDTPCGEPVGSRFYRDPQLDLVRLERRRQRVAVLALWRWIATLGALVPIVLGTVAAVAGWRPGPERIGSDIATWWGTLPFAGIIAGPVNFLAGTAAWPDWIPLLGEWLAGCAVLAIVFLILGRIGVGRWEAWDHSERVQSRSRYLEPVDRRQAAITFVTLTAVTAVLSALFLFALWRPA